MESYRQKDFTLFSRDLSEAQTVEDLVNINITLTYLHNMEEYFI